MTPRFFFQALAFPLIHRSFIIQIPDAVTNYYLQRAGFDCDDIRVYAFLFVFLVSLSLNFFFFFPPAFSPSCPMAPTSLLLLFFLLGLPACQSLEIDLTVSSATAAVLDQQIAVVIPSTVCPTPQSQCATCASWPCFLATESDLRILRTDTLEVLSSCFGGGYCQAVEGAWKSEISGELVFEDNIICRSFSTLELAERHLPQVLHHVRSMGKHLGQEMMALQVNHELLLIRPYHHNCSAPLCEFL